MGFASQDFYSDADESAYSSVRNIIKKMKSSSAVDWVFPFLTIIAPGGAGSDEDRKRLRNFFFLKCPKQLKSKIEHFEMLVQNWREREDLKEEEVIKDILKSIEGFSHTWVGKTQNFPEDGFFVENEFSYEEAMMGKKK